MHKKPTYDDLSQKIKALEFELNMYRSLYKKMGDGKFILNSFSEYANESMGIIEVLDEGQDFRYIWLNKVAEQYIGKSPKELQGMRVSELGVTEEVLRILIDECHKSELPGTSVQFEYKCTFSDGIHTLLASTSKIKSQCFSFIIFDITEQKRTEEELKESLERGKLWIDIVRDANLGVAVGYPDGRLGVSNHAFQKITGYTEKELQCINWNIVLTPNEWVESESAKLQELHETKKPVVYEKEYIRKDGVRIPIELMVSPVIDKDGNVHYYHAFVTDITERKKAEKELKDSQKKYQSLSKMLRLMCDNVPDMIWAKDFDKKFIFANKSICRDLLNAVDTNEPIGKTDLFFADRERDLDPKNPSWHTFGELCQDSDAITLEKGVPQQFDEFGNVKGKYLFLDVRKAPFVDETGKTIGVVGSARDVTEAKKIEGKLKKWNEELEDKIIERTRSLEDLNTALRVLLKKREEDKNQIGENIYANFKSLIQPLINQLRNSLTIKVQEDILNILESSIKEMTTPFSKKISDPMVGLTPTEIQVIHLVKGGKTNKEISQFLNKSIRAVSSHRNNIRQKLGLKNKKINLRTYLLSID